MSSPVDVLSPVATGAFDDFLKRSEEKELLRFTTAGSVDDGKSTLIGRLLYDSKGIYEDQLAAVAKASTNQSAGKLDFALLTDGLRAEREQGITIDVAYRYFSTPRRKFIIADTPGHEQYTRNMATGASTANLAIILVDARKGVLIQSRRHTFIASLLGISHLLVAVNKMDLVDYSEEIFERIRAEFSSFAAQFRVTDMQFIPISALMGDNVVEKSALMPWYEGPSLLRHLETVHIAGDINLTEMRFPVQNVFRPHQDFRGYAGQIASGVIRVGDSVAALPSGRTSRVKSIVTFDGELPKAFAPMSVTVCLEDEIDLSRGGMLAHTGHLPLQTRRIDARIVWMNAQPLVKGRSYLLKHTTQTVRATVTDLRYRISMSTLEKEAAPMLNLNDIGAAIIETNLPVFVDAYRRNRATGCFILIDPETNETMGAGMITARPVVQDQPAGSRQGRITAGERSGRIGHQPACVWLGGRRELAYAAERLLFDSGCYVFVLAESDPVRLSETARILQAAGMIVLCVSDAGVDAAEERFINATQVEGTMAEAASEVLRMLREAGAVSM